MSQCDRVLSYMREHTGITQLEATREFGCLRLAARIADLRHKGIAITDLWVEVPNRYGEKCKVKEYRLCGKI